MSFKCVYVCVCSGRIRSFGHLLQSNSRTTLETSQGYQCRGQNEPYLLLLYCLTLFFVTHSPFCIHQTVLEYACCFLKLKEETHLLCVWGYIIRSKLNWRGKGSTLGERCPVLWWSCPFMWARSCVVLCCAVLCLVTQLCLTFCDSMDCSPPGSSVHGILQARILEWVAISFSRDLPDPRVEPASLAWQADSLPLSHLGLYKWNTLAFTDTFHKCS